MIEIECEACGGTRFRCVISYTGAGNRSISIEDDDYIYADTPEDNGIDWEYDCIADNTFVCTECGKETTPEQAEKLTKLVERTL